MPADTFDPKVLVEWDGGRLRRTADRIGVDPSILCRPLSAHQVDRFVTRLGAHPTDVYGHAAWFDAVVDDDARDDDPFVVAIAAGVDWIAAGAVTSADELDELLDVLEVPDDDRAGVARVLAAMHNSVHSRRETGGHGSEHLPGRG